MKNAYAKTKDKAEQGYDTEENSPTEYASDRVSRMAGRVKDEGIHQFNRQGQKSVQTTRENIGKAKDKLSDFKTRRAVKAAEQKKAQQAADQTAGKKNHQDHRQKRRENGKIHSERDSQDRTGGGNQAIVEVALTQLGNSGDACKQNQYTVGSSSILGYGVPAY